MQPGYNYIDPIDLDSTSQLARIMFEADYSLKSLQVMPELFDKIPGFRTHTEYKLENRLIRKLMGKEALSWNQIWIEPKIVVMAVSPERNVVAFTSSQMLILTKDLNAFYNLPPQNKADDGWYAQLNNDYDAYARIIPAFHKIREAAKVIALAKWALAENTPRLEHRYRKNGACPTRRRRSGP